MLLMSIWCYKYSESIVLQEIKEGGNEIQRPGNRINWLADKQEKHF